MKRYANLILIFLIITTFTFGEFFDFGNKIKNRSNTSKNKIKIITTLFPIYDFSKQIAGDKAEVTLLLPPGAEAHSYDPTPRDIINIGKSNLFIYTSEEMEPWVQKIKKSLNNKKTIFINSSENISFEESNEEDHDKHEETHEHEHGMDPHIWTDPILAKMMVENIMKGIISVDPKNEVYYTERALEYIKELDNLDEAIRASVTNFKFKTIITGGHFALTYFAKRYNLDYISAYEGFSPNAEPKPKDVANLRKIIKENRVKYIYFEELIDPKIAKVLASETGVKLLLLHGAHNISKEELKNNTTYLQIMKNNLKNLNLGLSDDE